MEKRISYAQFQQVRAVAKACNPSKTKQQNVLDQITKLGAKYKELQGEIDALEAGVKTLTGGFGIDYLVKKEYKETADNNGKIVRVANYVPSDNVSYDEEKKQYVINCPDEPTGAAPATEEEVF